MTIVLSGNLLRFSDYVKEIEVDSATVDGALQGLVEQYPALKPVVFQPDGRIRGAHRLFHNGELIDIGDSGRALGPTDELSIVTAIAGG